LLRSTRPRRLTAGPFEDLGALSRDDAAAKLRELDSEIASIGARNTPDPIGDHARSSSMPSACWEGLSTNSQKSNEGKEPHLVPMPKRGAFDLANVIGADPNMAALFDELMAAIGKFSKQQVASRIGISRNSLAQILDIKCQKLSPRISQKIGSAIAALNVHSLGEDTQNAILLELARAETAGIGLSEFARRLQIDASNLSKVMDGKRKLSRQFARFERYFEGWG